MIDEDNKTLWCGNLPEQATEELLYELFLQAGPLEKIRIPKDYDGRQKNFAFVTFRHEVSVPYALCLFRGTALFQKTLSLQSRGRMAILPPPIRCYGPEPSIEFPQSNIAQQFANMTEHIKIDDYAAVHMPRMHEPSRNLSMASLQGNWSHRHHPYRAKDKPYRDDYRTRDKSSDNYNSNSRGNHSSNWRDRRNHQKGNYHRRD